jgi:hypothetical protein
MTRLPTREIARLLKTIALFDSPIDGERLAALEAANRILRKAGLNWNDLIRPREIIREPQFSIWRKTCAALLEHAGSLRPWEKNFVAGLPAFPRISSKQRWILDEIATRVLKREAA